jgi:hypothetical protein
MAFEYRDSNIAIRNAIRNDLVEANRRAWERIASPGSWWSGAERVALAAEVRAAARCALCAERKAALSPFAVEGEHGRVAALPAAAIDLVHRLTTDPGRLSRQWYDDTIAAGLTPDRYVEIVGLVTTVVSIDCFHRGIGAALEPLPEAQGGAPSNYRPAGVSDLGAYVPMIPGQKAKGPEAGLYGGLPTSNVMAAMSLVPDCVRELKSLSDAYYLPETQLTNPTATRGKLTRPQIELVAGRVSALNECFY